MRAKLLKKLEGFTIIEVMIVLAIAGLIMVIVFVAIPQLQRNTRNTRRRDVVNRIKAEVDNYTSNNNGVPPTADAAVTTGFNTGGGFPTRYLTNINIQDPSTGAAMTLATWTADNALAQGTASYVTGRTCNAETSQAGTARNYIVMTLLEGGARYCVDNS